MLITTHFSYDLINSDHSQSLLKELAKKRFPQSSTPLVEFLDYLKTAIQYFKMIGLNFISMSNGFNVAAIADDYRFNEAIESDLRSAREGYYWLSNIVYSFAAGVKQASLYSDQVKGSLGDYLSLHLLDEYLRQADGYYSDGRIDAFFRRRDLLSTTSVSNELFKTALVLWEDMKSKSKNSYVAYDGKVKNQIYNKARMVISDSQVDKRAYLIARNISQEVFDVVSQASKRMEVEDQASLYGFMQKIDEDPCSACIFVNEILNAVLSWNGKWNELLDGLYRTKRDCLTILPLATALGSMIGWCMKNVPDLISSMVNSIMQGSSELFVSRNIPSVVLPERYINIFTQTDLQYDEILRRDNLLSSMGLLGQGVAVSQIAKMFEVCYNYLIKMERWAINTNVSYPIVDIATGKSVKFFYQNKDGLSFLEYRQSLEMAVSNIGHGG